MKSLSLLFESYSDPNNLWHQLLILREINTTLLGIYDWFFVIWFQL